MMGIFSVTGAASALLFTLLWFFRRSPNKNQADCISYDVMERSDKRIALCNRSKFSWLMGLTYSGLFFLSLPVLIWRYGKYLSLWVIAIPFVSSLAISHLVASDGSAMFLSIVLLIILRAICGLYLVANDLKFQKKALFSRGWRMIGSCEVSSRKNAMVFFKESLSISDTDDKKVRSGWSSILTGLKTRLPNCR
jgi:hypothetical protein